MAGFWDFLQGQGGAQPDGQPGMMQKFSQGARDFGGHVQETVQHPLFQMGAGMTAAGGEGKNIGAGFAAGAAQANTSQQQQLQTQTAQRQMVAQKMRDDFQASLNGPSPPAWFKSLSPQMQGVLRALPPDQSGQILGQMSMNQAQIGAQMAAKRNEMAYARELDLQQRQDTLNLMDRYQQQRTGGQAPPQAPPTDGRYKYVPGAGVQ